MYLFLLTILLFKSYFATAAEVDYNSQFGEMSLITGSSICPSTLPNSAIIQLPQAIWENLVQAYSYGSPCGAHITISNPINSKYQSASVEGYLEDLSNTQIAASEIVFKTLGLRIDKRNQVEWQLT